MDKPMTTEELFNRIKDILKEKGKLPDILDYGLATHNPVPITTYEFDLRNKLAYGGSEGIYLDLWIEYFANKEKQRKSIGTFKTLDESNEAMYIMAKLLADFIIEEYSYVNANLDDFTWEGFDVHAFDEEGKRYGWGYTCATMESALNRKNELLKKYTQVVVRDNATRKETIFDHDNPEKGKSEADKEMEMTNERTGYYIEFNDYIDEADFDYETEGLTLEQAIDTAKKVIIESKLKNCVCAIIDGWVSDDNDAVCGWVMFNSGVDTLPRWREAK